MDDVEGEAMIVLALARHWWRTRASRYWDGPDPAIPAPGPLWPEGEDPAWQSECDAMRWLPGSDGVTRSHP